MRPPIERRLSFRLWALPKRPAVADRSLLLLGTLRKLGWMRSIGDEGPVDGEGMPVPWWTYSGIHFVERSLRGDETVFEYGSGQSTRWLARRVKAVHSVEHDAGWARTVRASLSDNVSLMEKPCNGDGLSAPDGDEYVTAIRAVTRPDVVVIDGRARLSCVEEVCRLATGHELIIVDDSHWPAYAPALLQLAGAGFARIDFVGPGPARTNFSATSAFFSDLSRWAMPRTCPYDWGGGLDKDES